MIIRHTFEFLSYSSEYTSLLRCMFYERLSTDRIKGITCHCSMPRFLLKLTLFGTCRLHQNADRTRNVYRIVYKPYTRCIRISERRPYTKRKPYRIQTVYGSHTYCTSREPPGTHTNHIRSTYEPHTKHIRTVYSVRQAKLITHTASVRIHIRSTYMALMWYTYSLRMKLITSSLSHYVLKCIQST